MAYLGGFIEEPGKIFFGGAMTGLCIPSMNIPMAKSTNGIIAFNEKESWSMEEGPCIRCAKCVYACPIGLNPYRIKMETDCDRLDAAKKLLT